MVQSVKWNSVVSSSLTTWLRRPTPRVRWPQPRSTPRASWVRPTGTTLFWDLYSMGPVSFRWSSHGAKCDVGGDVVSPDVTTPIQGDEAIEFDVNADVESSAPHGLSGGLEGGGERLGCCLGGHPLPKRDRRRTWGVVSRGCTLRAGRGVRRDRHFGLRGAVAIQCELRYRRQERLPQNQKLVWLDGAWEQAWGSAWRV